MNFDHRKRKDIEFVKSQLPTNFIGDEFVIFTSADMPIVDHPRKADSVSFLICIKGNSELSINLKNNNFKENDLFIITPGQIIQFFNYSEDFTVKCISMSPEFLEDSVKGTRNIVPFLLRIMDNPFVNLNSDDLSSLLEYHSLLARKVRMENLSDRKEIVRGLLHAICHEISAIYEKNHPLEHLKRTRKEEIFKAFMTELSKSYKISRSVTFYAEKLNLDSKHFSNSIKVATGRLASEWIETYIVLEAKVMLRSTEKTIQQISDELNFANQSFFGKYFKQHTGISPRQYRESRQTDPNFVL